MGERIQIRCEIDGEPAYVQAELSVSHIEITQDGKIVAAIIREPDGSYSATAKTSLSPADITAVGKQIELYIKHYR